MGQENKELVVVYGTLRDGMGNHHVIQQEGTEKLGLTKISGFVMKSYGGFPYVYSTSDSSKEIVVEVYEVTRDTLEYHLDILEGYPSFYDRQKIDTVFGEAWIYFIKYEDHEKFPTIESGDWAAHIEEKSY